MKQQARKGIFETNSSSTHTLSLVNKEMWERFKNNNDVYFNIYENNSLVTKEDIEKSNDYKNFVEHYHPNFNNLNKDEKDDVFEEYLYDEYFYTNDNLNENYEVLTEEVPDSNYVAVSIYGAD